MGDTASSNSLIFFDEMVPRGGMLQVNDFSYLEQGGTLRSSRILLGFSL
jgi:hypothetical protein